MDLLHVSSDKIIIMVSELKLCSSIQCQFMSHFIVNLSLLKLSNYCFCVSSFGEKGAWQLAGLLGATGRLCEFFAPKLCCEGRERGRVVAAK